MKKLVSIVAVLSIFIIAGAAWLRAESGDSEAPKQSPANAAKKCCQEQKVVAAKTKACAGDACGQKKSAGECASCKTAKKALAATTDASKCKLCSQDDCKKECTDCKEARLKATTDNSTAAPGRGGGWGRGRGRGMGRGPGHADDAAFQKDHEDFFFLLEHRESIRRTVDNLPNGIVTVTESDNGDVAGKIQEHVEAMYERLENSKPIHMRDPLFRELFENVDKIEMKVEHTEKGVRVKETSEDAYVAELLQEHAKVVSLFIQNGFSELPKNHALPKN